MTRLIKKGDLVKLTNPMELEERMGYTRGKVLVAATNQELETEGCWLIDTEKDKRVYMYATQMKLYMVRNFVEGDNVRVMSHSTQFTPQSSLTVICAPTEAAQVKVKNMLGTEEWINQDKLILNSDFWLTVPKVGETVISAVSDCDIVEGSEYEVMNTYADGSVEVKDEAEDNWILDYDEYLYNKREDEPEDEQEESKESLDLPEIGEFVRYTGEDNCDVEHGKMYEVLDVDEEDGDINVKDYIGDTWTVSYDEFERVPESEKQDFLKPKQPEKRMPQVGDKIILTTRFVDTTEGNLYTVTRITKGETTTWLSFRDDVNDERSIDANGSSYKLVEATLDKNKMTDEDLTKYVNLINEQKRLEKAMQIVKDNYEQAVKDAEDVKQDIQNQLAELVDKYK